MPPFRSPTAAPDRGCRPTPHTRTPRQIVPLRALAALVLATACGEAPTAARLAGTPRPDILDGAHGTGGNAHFYFLQPMVKAPTTFTGVFDPTQAPTVEICAWDATLNAGAGDCSGADVATFSTTAGNGSEIVRVEPANQQYIVNWHTDQSSLDVTRTYRIRVLVGSYELGHADVDPVTSGSQLKDVNTGQYIGLVDGRTLPITFRVEQGAVSPASPVGVQALAAGGGFHACALTSAGAAYCWGRNDYGELGTGTASATPVATPQPVASGPAGPLTFRAIVTTSHSTCALTPAGAAYCWGGNSEGEFGNAGIISAATPLPAAGGLTFVSLAAGWFHVCGITTDGTAYCWGDNEFGQLGNGNSAVTAALTPTPVAVPVPGLRFTSLSAGSFVTCGIATDAQTYCWGYNMYGELGRASGANGSTSNATPQAVSTTTAFSSAVVGFGQVCALDAAGAAWCWGDNRYGELGSGVTSAPGTIALPQPVAGSIAFARLTAGSVHTCGLTTAGAAYCWGNNLYGELGTGTITNVSPYGIATPTAVPGLTFNSLAAGGNLTCGILTDGTARCWGIDSAGQLGTGVVGSPSATPQTVIGGLTFLGS